MTTKGFVASHAKDASFERGLRSFYEYRDLGIRDATRGAFGARGGGRVVAGHHQPGGREAIPRAVSAESTVARPSP